MKTNYLLIDFENVQPQNLALLNGVSFKVKVFLGANQSRVPVEFAAALQKLGADAEYIQIQGSGRNALDFHIAYLIGELAANDPSAYFHVISKDTGFDPLIKYAKRKGIFIQRSKEIAEIPILKLSNTKSQQEKVDAIVRNLAARGAGRPRKIKTLSNTINAIFLKGLSDLEINELVSALKKHGHISTEGENVSYHMKAAP